MYTKSKKQKKSRAQKKFKIVGIVSCFFATIFIATTVISAINIPKKDEFSSIVGNNYIQDLSKGQDNSYYVTALKKSGGNVTDGYLYHFDKKDKAIEKVNVFEQAKDKYSITGLSNLVWFYPNYETNNAYIASGEYVFSFSGLNQNSLELSGYSNCFGGEVKRIVSSDTELFVLAKDGTNVSITKFDVGDTTFTPKAKGYIYKNVKYTEGEESFYRLTAYTYEALTSTYVDDNYLYLIGTRNSFVLDTDLSGCNYRVLFENELPGRTIEQATEECITKYGWRNYDYNNDVVEIFASDFEANKKSFQYNYQDKVGSAIYGENLVMVGRDRYFYSMDLYSLSHPGRIINNLDDIAIFHSNLLCPNDLARIDNAICYYGVGNKAVIRYYDNTNEISYFNLEKMTFEYTVAISTCISNAFVNDETQNIYYKFQDTVNRSADRNYICRANVPLEMKAKTIKGLLIASIVLLVISLIFVIVCFSSFSFKRSADAVIRTGKGLKKHWPIYVIILPSFALLCLFCYYPGISAIFTSFFEYKPGVSELKTWNNFDNYKQIFGNAQSLRHFGNMLIFLAIDLIIASIPPLIFAFFLSVLKNKKMSGVLRTLLFIPGIIPGVAGILIWRECIYGPYGLVNVIIKGCGGTPITNFFDPTSYSSIITLFMMGFPFVGSYLIFYGSMMNIPSSYYEAAEIDGITVTKRFFKIDLPLCLPQLKYVIIMTIIASIQNFSRIWIGMDGDPGVINTPITKMYDLMYSSERNYGLASAYATVLFVILFGLTFVSMRKKASNQIK